MYNIHILFCAFKRYKRKKNSAEQEAVFVNFGGDLRAEFFQCGTELGVKLVVMLIRASGIHRAVVAPSLKIFPDIIIGSVYNRVRLRVIVTWYVSVKDKETGEAAAKVVKASNSSLDVSAGASGIEAKQ